MTRVGGSNGKWTKPQEEDEFSEMKATQPDMSDILAALRATKHSWPPFSPSEHSELWSIDEHEKFIIALQKYPQGPYERVSQFIGKRTLSEVENYALKCWRSDKYQGNVAGDSVKIEMEEPSDDFVKIEPDEVPEGEKNAKRHRVRKWFRRTFDWCVDVLSFRCLRAKKPATYATRSVDTNFYGLTMQGSRPMRSGSRPSAYRPTRPSAYRPTPSSTYRPTQPPVMSTDEESFDDIPTTGFPSMRMDEGQPRRTAELLNEFALDAPSFAWWPYLPSVAARNEDDDDDDLEMRIARQTAAEIEWYDTAEKLRDLADTQQNTGAWSKEEHERYCEGLDKYRYGSWKLIADFVGTRTESQVRSHAQSVRAKRKRAEEREKRGETGKTRVNARTGTNKSARTAAATKPTTASSLSSTGSRKLTPEELLIASMANSVAESSSARLPTNVLMADKNRPNTDAATPPVISRSTDLYLGVEFQFQELPGIEITDALPFVSVNNENSVRCEQEELVTNANVSKDDVETNHDIPLCSPPLDIMVGSFLSDEDLFEILETPSC